MEALSLLDSLFPANMPPKISYSLSFCRSLHTSLLQDQLRSLAAGGRLEEALSLLSRSTSAAPGGGPPIDVQTYAALFHSCARFNSLHHGIAFHRLLQLFQGDSNLSLSQPDQRLFLTNHLINMYAKCGDLPYARILFDEMSHRNHVSWTALISGYAQHGRGDECFLIFSAMLSHFRPNEFAFASVLSSCIDGGESDEQRGKKVHALALKISIDASVYVANALISMYSKARGYGAKEAWAVFRTMGFRNLISWNSMIAGFQLQGLGGLAIDLFLQMHRHGLGFDRATLLSLLSSLSSVAIEEGVDTVGLGLLKFCFQLHCLATRSGLISEIEVATALVKAYSDLGGDVAECYSLFLESDAHSRRDIVLWTSIITAFAEHEPEESLFLFRKLLQEGIATLDRYTFSSILKACAGLTTEKHALSVHSLLIKYGLDRDIVVANSLIHAYARCSSVALARKVFEGMESRDLVSWNSILKAHALHGQGRETLQLFGEMSLPPDSATFVALLSACSHSGFVEDGIRIFDMMSRDYGIVPQLDHYACMVDILGRAGRVLEAQHLIDQMPVEPDSVVWSALLSACIKHRETQLAAKAAARLKMLDPVRSLGYVQISNIYCSGGRYNEASRVRKEMRGSGVRKEPGLSWVEIGNKIHEFASGGYRHPRKEVICDELERFIGRLKELGYVPETSLALHDIEEEHKEEQLHYHSEKLALMFAIMMGQGRSRQIIKIIKNIRICVDCHNFMKLASGAIGKEVVVRDSNRFHHFKDQVCSCNDYW